MKNGKNTKIEQKQIKSGISLIVLVITIVVIVILAVAVILSVAKNNPIENAKKAAFQNDLQTMQEEVNMYIASKYADSLGNVSDVNLSGDAMVEALPSTKKYKDKVSVVGGKLVVFYDKVTSAEREWASEILSLVSSGYGTNGNNEENVAYVNAPVLAEGMTPITFDDDGNAVKTTSTDSNWYAYKS